MKLEDYRFDGATPLRLQKMPTTAKRDKLKKEEALAKTERNLARLGELQEKLYADGRESVVFVFQAMDAAGKDSAIKHVMGAFNPQGVDVVTFKQPTAEELAHDYLWRAARALPERGKIGIFNRSHYEDVLVVRVRELYRGYKMPVRCLEGDLFARRFRQIRDFEEYLYDNGCRIVKFFLNVSKAEQKNAFSSGLSARKSSGSSTRATSTTARCGTIICAHMRTRSTKPRPRTARGTFCPPTRSGTRAISCPRLRSPLWRTANRSIRSSAPRTSRRWRAAATACSRNSIALQREACAVLDQRAEGYTASPAPTTTHSDPARRAFRLLSQNRRRALRRSCCLCYDRQRDIYTDKR